MEAAIVGVLGAGLLGLLGIFLQGMRSDIRALGERFDVRFEEGEGRLLARIEEGEGRLLARIGALEAGDAQTHQDLGEVKERLSRIEATQDAHGQLLAHMMSHGERIATLEGAAAAG